MVNNFHYLFNVQYLGVSSRHTCRIRNEINKEEVLKKPRLEVIVRNWLCWFEWTYEKVDGFRLLRKYHERRRGGGDQDSWIRGVRGGWKNRKKRKIEERKEDSVLNRHKTLETAEVVFNDTVFFFFSVS